MGGLEGGGLSPRLRWQRNQTSSHQVWACHLFLNDGRWWAWRWRSPLSLPRCASVMDAASGSAAEEAEAHLLEPIRLGGGGRGGGGCSPPLPPPPLLPPTCGRAYHSSPRTFWRLFSSRFRRFALSVGHVSKEGRHLRMSVHLLEKKKKTNKQKRRRLITDRASEGGTGPSEPSTASTGSSSGNKSLFFGV